tara:strand:+ start:1317 stop:1784 length:468 start_codon:yes stop_codon:yes gene_type:complete
MPGKQKKNPNPLREIKDMIHRLSGKYGTRAEEEQYAREIESDPFYQSLQRIEEGELQAVQRADALDKERKKIEKKKGKLKPKTGFFKEMQKEALDEGVEEFNKTKKEKQADEKAKEEFNKRVNKAYEEDKVLKRLKNIESWLERNRISPSDPYNF